MGGYCPEGYRGWGVSGWGGIVWRGIVGAPHYLNIVFQGSLKGILVFQGNLQGVGGVDKDL